MALEATFRDRGRVDSYRVVQAIHFGNVEFFVMDGDVPVGALLLRPVDGSEGFQVRHATLDDGCRGRRVMSRVYLGLIESGVALFGDSDRSEAAESVWRWLADRICVARTTLPDGSEVYVGTNPRSAPKPP